GSRSKSYGTCLTRPSAAEHTPPLELELRGAQAIDTRNGLGDRLAGAQPFQELADGLDPAAVEAIRHDPEGDVVSRPGARTRGLRGSARTPSLRPGSRRSDTIQRAMSYPVRARSGSDSPASASTPAS